MRLMTLTGPFIRGISFFGWPKTTSSNRPIAFYSLPNYWFLTGGPWRGSRGSAKNNKSIKYFLLVSRGPLVAQFDNSCPRNYFDFYGSMEQKMLRITVLEHLVRRESDDVIMDDKCDVIASNKY